MEGSQSVEPQSGRAQVAAAAVLALGLVAGGFVLGLQLKHLRAVRQTIAVKGLAEKPVRADRAEWTVGLKVNAPTFAETLAKLRKERPSLDLFLAQQGLEKGALQDASESVEPNMEEEELEGGRTRQVQKGFVGTQDILVRTDNLAKVVDAHKSVLQFQAEGHPVSYSRPLFLVSNLEEVKMSLIGAATRNARTRAEEFAKNGDVSVGVMISASQGAFYILQPGASVDSSEYGGAYDKSTIDKIARVVVTIEYSIDR